MTDVPISPDDELVSAYLDGEATPDERARVDDDPVLLSRVDDLRRNASAIRHTRPEPPPGAVESMLAAARLAADEVLAPPSVDSNVVAMAGRRRRPSMLLTLSAAAAVVVVLGFVGVAIFSSQSRSADPSMVAAPGAPERATNQGGSGSGDGAKGAAGNEPAAGAAAPSTTVDAANAGPQSTASASAPDGTASALPSTSTSSRSSPTSTSPASSPSSPRSGDVVPANGLASSYRGDDLGPLTSAADLRAAVVTRFATSASAPTVTAPATTTSAVTAQLLACDTSVRSDDAELGGALYSATATYRANAALVLLYAIAPSIGNANGPTRLYTVDRASCAVLDVQTF